MKTVRERLTMMLLGWGAVGIVYSIGRAATHPARVLHEGALDRAVAFTADAVWVYLSFFAIVPLAYLCARAERLTPLTRAMQQCALACAPVFVLWPTTLAYPTLATDSVSGRVLAALSRFDSPQNCLPSLHGALTVLAVIALFERRHPWRSAIVGLWGLAIAWSVVATRRHLALDLCAGVLLGSASAALVGLPALRSWSAARALPTAGRTTARTIHVAVPAERGE
jgi:hypothetical protein